MLAIQAIAACSCGDDKKPVTTGQIAEDLSPVPEPEGVSGELFISKPDQTWKRIRTLGGGPLNLLPASYPVVVTTLLGLPPTTSGAFDTEVPTIGAIVSTAPDRLSVVLAIHVKSGRELVAALSSGGEAKYGAKLDSQSGVTLIEPKPGRADASMALGIVGNHLIAAPESALVTRFGPFVARTLAKKQMPADGIVAELPKKALAGPVAGTLRARWKAYRSELKQADRKNREKHGGRAPDFGDPMVALGGVGAAVEGLADALESSKRAKLVVMPLDERLEARVEVEAEPGGKAAKVLDEMAVGDLAPLLGLPKGMDLAIFNRTTLEGRKESAKTVTDGAARLFGDRLNDADKTKIARVIDDLAVGRGDEATYGLLSKDDRTALVFRGKVADAKRFADGVKGALELLKLRAVSEPVKQFVGELTIKHGATDVAGIDGKVERATLTLKPSAMQAPAGTPAVAVGPKSFELLWFVEDGLGYAALSAESQTALVALATATGAGALGGDALIQGAAGRIGGNVSFAVYVQPLALGLGGMKSSAPVLIALGKNGATGWLRADADRAAVRALVQRFLKL